MSEVKYFFDKRFDFLKDKVNHSFFSTFITCTGHIASAISISVSFPANSVEITFEVGFTLNILGQTFSQFLQLMHQSRTFTDFIIKIGL
jgi:hypothetical protein